MSRVAQDRGRVRERLKLRATAACDGVNGGLWLEPRAQADVQYNEMMGAVARCAAARRSRLLNEADGRAQKADAGQLVRELIN